MISEPCWKCKKETVGSISPNGIRVPICPACNPIVYRGEEEPEPEKPCCSKCHGDQTMTCPECNGEGTVECDHCGGTGDEPS